KLSLTPGRNHSHNVRRNAIVGEAEATPDRSRATGQLGVTHEHGSRAHCRRAGGETGEAPTMKIDTLLKQVDAKARSLLLDQLTRTENHIRSDAQHLLGQQSIVAELERRGEDSTQARSFLRHLEEMMAMRLADRDRMRTALGSSPSLDVDP